MQGECNIMQQSTTQQPVAQAKRAMLGFLFSLAGAILILLRGIVRIVVGDIITFAGSDVIRHRFLAGITLNILGGIAVLFAVLILVGAYLTYMRMEVTGGVIILVFSVLSIFAGSGWLIGLILALVGGVLGLLKK